MPWDNRKKCGSIWPQSPTDSKFYQGLPWKKCHILGIWASSSTKGCQNLKILLKLCCSRIFTTLILLPFKGSRIFENHILILLKGSRIFLKIQYSFKKFLFFWTILVGWLEEWRNGEIQIIITKYHLHPNWMKHAEHGNNQITYIAALWDISGAIMV